MVRMPSDAMGDASPYISDITEESGFSQRDLQRMYEGGIRFSDSETTGLNRDVNGFTEFASIKAVLEDGAYRLKLFQAHMLPVKPNFQDYLSYAARGEHTPTYDPSMYEYEVEAQALQVTGTRFLREYTGGPITGMEIDGKPIENARPFYEVADALTGFLRSDLPEGIPVRDLYFNAPFDKPFLGQMLRDVAAWQKVMQDTSLETLHDRSEAFDAARQQQREPAIAQGLDLYNSADWRCLMHTYLHDQGFGATNTLDDAYRKLVDPTHTKRGDHAAVEDILMEARVGLKLMERHDPIPSMAELYEKVLVKADRNVSVTAADPRISDGKEIQGDIVIRFSRPAEELHGRAKKYWDYCAAFAEAKERNSRVPNHIARIDPKNGEVVISAERKAPLSLNMLRKLMVYEKMLDAKDKNGKPVFSSLAPFDSTGNRIDVHIRRQKAPVEDVHFGSLRANLTYFSGHTDTLREDLELVRALREHDRKIGMCVFREGETEHAFRVRGHLRSLGDVTFALPPGKSAGQERERIMADVDFLLAMGLIPSAEGLEASHGEEGDEDEDAPNPKDRAPSVASLGTDVDLAQGTDRLTLRLSPLLFNVIAHIRKIDASHCHDGVWHVPAIGNVDIAYTLPEHGAHEGSYRLTGSKTAFRESGLASQVRDLTWLVYRLERLQDTAGVNIVAAPKYYDPHGIMADVEQVPATSLQTMELLTRAGVPYKAYRDHIRLDLSQLLVTSYDWSQRIGDIRGEMKEEARRKKQQPAISPKIADLHAALLEGRIHAVEADDMGRLYINDGAGTHYPLDRDSTRIDIIARGDKQLEDFRRGFDGAQRALLMHDGSGEKLHASPVMAALVRAELAQAGVTEIPQTEPGNPHAFIYHETSHETLSAAIHAARDTVVALQRLGGGKRLQHTLYLDENAQALVVNVPSLPLLEEEHHASLTFLSDALSNQELRTNGQRVRTPMHHISATDRRRADNVSLGSSMDILKDVEAFASSARKLSATLRKNRAAPSRPRDVTFFKEQHGHLGMMLHEIADRLDKVAPDDRTANARDDFGRIRHVKALLARLSEGIARLDGTLASTLSLIDGTTGVPSYFKILATIKMQGIGQMTCDVLASLPEEERRATLAEELLTHAERERRYDYSLSAPMEESSLRSHAVQSLMKWEHDIRGLLQLEEKLKERRSQHNESSDKESGRKHADPEMTLRQAYLEGALAMLSTWQSNDDEKSTALAAATWMLQRSQAFDGEEVTRLVDAFVHADQWDRDALIEHFGRKNADLALLGRKRMSASELLATLDSHIPQQAEERLGAELKKIADAHLVYAALAAADTPLLNTLQSNHEVAWLAEQASSLTQQERTDRIHWHRDTAQQALEAAGLSEDAIHARMNRKRTITPKTVAYAEKILSPEEYSHNPLSLILGNFHEGDVEENLSRAHEIIARSFEQKNRLYTRHLTQSFSEPYADLKARRASIARAQRLAGGVSDILNVKNHVAAYMQQTLALMAVPQQKSAIAASLAPLEAAATELEDTSLLHRLRDTRDEMHVSAVKATEDALSTAGMGFTKQSDGATAGTRFIIPLREIIKNPHALQRIAALDDPASAPEEIAPASTPMPSASAAEEPMPTDILTERLHTLQREGSIKGYALHDDGTAQILVRWADTHEKRQAQYAHIKDAMEVPFWREPLENGDIREHCAALPEIEDILPSGHTPADIVLRVEHEKSVPYDLRPHVGKALARDNQLIKAIAWLKEIPFDRVAGRGITATVTLRQEEAQMLEPCLDAIHYTLKLSRPPILSYDNGAASLSVAREDIARLGNPLPPILSGLHWSEPGPGSQWHALGERTPFSLSDHAIADWMREEPAGGSYLYATAQGELAKQLPALWEDAKRHGMSVSREPLIHVSHGLGRIASAVILIRRDDARQWEGMAERLSLAERFRKRDDSAPVR